MTVKAKWFTKKVDEVIRSFNSAVRWIAWVPFGRFTSPRAIREFSRLSSTARTIGQAVDLVLSFRFFRVLVAPIQIREEIVGLLKVVEAAQPSTVLEIGTAKGGTLFLFTRVAREDALLISVDMPHGDFGGGYPGYMVPLLRSFARSKQDLHLVQGDSHKDDTKKEIEKLLAGRKVDFLFIDGDHRYEGVKKDFEMYSGLVSEGGMIAFHDIVPGPPSRAGGVARFWSEVKDRYAHEEFIRNPDQGGFGIGILLMR